MSSKSKIGFNLFSLCLILVIMLVVFPFSLARAATMKEGPPPFDLIEFLKTAGIIFLPMTTIVFGWVDYLGKMGVSGKRQLIASLLSGLILGGIVMYFTTYPATPVAWFSVILFGLLTGLAASGCYEGIKTAAAKGTDRNALYDRFPR